MPLHSLVSRYFRAMVSIGNLSRSSLQRRRRLTDRLMLLAGQHQARTGFRKVYPADFAGD